MFPVAVVRSPWALLAVAVLGVLGYFIFSGYSNPCKVDGPVTDIYRNGQPASQFFCKNGKPDGPATFWRENGTKKSEGAFLDGLQDGEWTYYDPDGNVERRTRWSRGAKRLDE
jgi:antitoxin component YwqK of YwqJK toxin-antitoxin module